MDGWRHGCSPILFTREQWLPRRREFCALVGKPAGAEDAIAQGKQELHAALAELETVLAEAQPGDTGAVRLDDGRLVIPPLSAEDVPAEARALREELAAMLPLAPIANATNLGLTRMAEARGARTWERSPWSATTPPPRPAVPARVPAADRPGGTRTWSAPGPRRPRRTAGPHLPSASSPSTSKRNSPNSTRLAAGGLRPLRPQDPGLLWT
ncbi:hypothetical protein ACQEU6_06480 [Spirillospora sp. CA-108201]